MRKIKIIHPEGNMSLITIQTVHSTATNLRYTTRHGSKWINRDICYKMLSSDWVFIKGLRRLINQL